MSLLATYLNDHLAGATAGRELARRTAAANRGTPYGEPLTRIAEQIDEDRRTLLAAMAALGAGVDRAKVALGWSAEKLGRLKPNGRLLSYSPLSRVVEIDALSLAVTGKLSLWRALRETHGEDDRLAAIDLGELERRALAQREELEGLLRAAAREALA